MMGLEYNRRYTLNELTPMDTDAPATLPTDPAAGALRTAASAAAAFFAVVVLLYVAYIALVRPQPAAPEKKAKKRE